MSNWPKTGCSILTTSKGKVLLAKRGKPPFLNCWSLPGGSQEEGETLEACAERELLEETNLQANKIDFLFVRDRIGYNDEGELTHHFVLSTFLCTSYSGSLQAGDDAADVGWFTLDEIKDLDTTPDLYELVRPHVIAG